MNVVTCRMATADALKDPLSYLPDTVFFEPFTVIEAVEAQKHALRTAVRKHAWMKNVHASAVVKDFDAFIPYVHTTRTRAFVVRSFVCASVRPSARSSVRNVRPRVFPRVHKSVHP